MERPPFSLAFALRGRAETLRLEAAITDFFADVHGTDVIWGLDGRINADVTLTKVISALIP